MKEMNYYFDNTLQSKYNLLNEFFVTYNQKNLTEVIKSIDSNTLEITLTFDNLDSKGIYDAVKAFIDVR